MVKRVMKATFKSATLITIEVHEGEVVYVAEVEYKPRKQIVAKEDSAYGK